MAKNKPKDDPQDDVVNPITLRDTLLIWLFATVNRDNLKQIHGKTMSAQDLRSQLEQSGSIRINNDENIHVCDDVCQNIQVDDNFDILDVIRGIVVKLPTLKGIWTGPQVHPEGPELNAAFLPLSGQPRVARLRTATPGGKQTRSGKKRTGTKRVWK